MKKLSWIFLILFLILFIAPLFVRPFISPDETRYAQIAWEMNDNSNYVSPTLNGTKYFEKPVMGYWIFAGSMKVFGENAFAMRLPVAIAAGLAALLVFLLARRYGGGEKVAFLAAGIYLTMPIVFVLASVAILDGMFSLFVTATMAAFFLAVADSGTKKKYKMLLLFCAGAFAGCAFMVKGFLGFALPVIVILPYLIWEKRWKDIFILPWLPLLGAAAVIAPWAAAVHCAEPDYWRYFIVEEHLLRFLGGSGVEKIQEFLGMDLMRGHAVGEVEAQHAEPFYYFIPVLLIGAVQWFLLSPVIGIGLKHLKFLQNKLMRYSVCWFLAPFIFFSLSSGKLASYILPCFAPLALIAAAGLYQYVVEEKRVKYLNVFSLILVVVLLVAGIGFSVYQFSGGLGIGEPLFNQEELYKSFVVIIAGLLCVAVFLKLCLEHDPWKKLLYFILGFTPVILAAHIVVPQMMLDRKAPSALIASVVNELPEDVVLVSWHHPFQALCWEFKRDDVYLFLNPGEIEYGINEGQKHRLLDADAFKALVEESKGKSGLLLVIPNKNYYEEKEYYRLPDPEWEKGPDSKKAYRLIKY